jgi:hypothetical protein
LQYNLSSDLANDQHPLRQEIESIRLQADYVTGEESSLEPTNDGAPSAEEVKELAEAVAAAPSSDDVSGGES